MMPNIRKRYVGLDVHKDVVEYCILDRQGKKLDGGRFICEKSVLVNFAQKVLSPKDQIALEATTNTWAVVDILEPFVEKIAVGNSLKTKIIAEAKVKTDKVDAMILAQLLQCDFLPTVWIPDKQTRELRRISSFRKSLVQEATAAKNRIKGILNHLLIKHAVTWSVQGMEELKSLSLPSVERTIMDSEIAILEHLELQIKKIELEIQKLAYDEDNIRLLMTLPSIGYNTATALLAVLGDISRFKVRYVPPLADVYKNEGLPPALAFDELSSGEQRILKEMGVAEKVRAKEKIGMIVQQKKVTSPPKQSGK
jgi:transposase